jgi:hypothetical protein
VYNAFYTTMTVVNYGTIVGNYHGASGDHRGVDIGGGVVINGASNSTAAYIAGGNGIEFNGHAGTVVNWGTIRGDYSVAYGVEMYYGSGGTVIDGGTIIGSADAIDFNAAVETNRFGPVGNNLVELYTSAVLVGNVVAAGANNRLELSTGAGTGTIDSIGTKFQGFATITVDAGASWSIGGVSTLVAGASLANAGMLQTTGTLMSSGTLTDTGTLVNAGTILALGQALQVAAGGSLINTGSIGGNPASGAAVSVAAGGFVTNQANAVITGYTGIIAAGEVVLTNAGTVSGNTSHGSGIQLHASGSVTNQSGGTISGFYGVYATGGPATVANAGSIAGGALGGIGVELRAGGVVTNQAGGVISGGNGGVSVIATRGTVVNAGSIDSTDLGNGYAVILNAGGFVTNQSGGVMVGTRGVEVAASAGTVTNAGTIAGTSLGVSFFSAAGTLTNQSGGTISGGFDAVRFAAGYSNLLVIDPGAVFDGTVTGGNTAGATAVSVLELAAGPGAGTLTGLGSQFVDFVQATIDSGASWTFASSNTIGAGYTLTNDGTLTNTGTLTNAGTLVDNGIMLNTGAATLLGPLIVAGTLDNASEITVARYRGLQLSPGGSLYNAVDGYIGRAGTGTGFNPVVFAATGGDSTIRNLGTIKNATGGSAVYLAGGGTITNGSASDTTALLYGTVSIYVYQGRGTVINFGAIEANPTFDGVGIELNQGGVVVNGAPGSAAASILGVQYGIAAFNGPTTLTNFGTITASFNGFGFDQHSGIATVFNAGVIGASNGSGVGIELQGGGTIVDSGTVAGATYAIRFGGTGSNLLVLEHGYEFFGLVQGSAGASNTVELVGSVGASVTLKLQPGGGLVNFQTVEFGPGAGNAATLDITNDAELPGTIAGFVGIHDMIDLTALSDVGNDATTSFNAATDVLTVAGDNGSVQLQLDNEDYTGIAFVASQDGAGGTMITPGHEPLTISGTTAGQAITDETTLTPFAGVTISDPDIGTSDTLTITLTVDGVPSDANGTLSGTGLTKTGAGTYTLAAGSPAAVTAALRALVFTPAAHEVAPGDTVTTGMTLSVTDGSSPVTDGTTSVVTTAVNDPPAITGTVADQLMSDVQTKQPFSTVTITDPDVGASETVTITLDVDGSPSDANGILSGTGLTKTGTGTYTLAAGSPAAVTAALRALVFTPAVLDLPPDSAAVTDMTLSVSDGIAGSPTTDTTTSVDIVPCFAAGTRIATPRGAIPVERLREGDTVLTISGKPQPIQWIGRRTLDCNRHIAPERVKPIRIAPHAFGENRPCRALLLSPDHSVFVEDVLIPVKHLVNGTTVTQTDAATVTYYHVELPRHDVVLAEGLPAETYLETGARFAFETGGGAVELHPDFAPDEARVGMVWQNFSYARLIGSDGELDRVRARLALQALMLEHQASAAPQRAKKRAGR